MRCPNCNVVWGRFSPFRTTTMNSGYCRNCGAGPYLADEVQVIQEAKKEVVNEKTS